ncbi:PaaI family thioesterase [Emticicia agri]|uniref:PaaI family thioesterase n=1 Tax=Emticicia agri TaxID=2492393 RepID=A0A4Q5M383_9BACT|nr:PaaI family thioesterase [Emticicia agri]RYU96826.1 PaaI family thioesterase [Emticicia agri]
MTKQNRERTFQWDNPLEGAKQALQMSGLDYLQAMGDGKIPFPPLLHTLDFKPTHLEKGKVIFSFKPQEFHYNPIGSVHGGVISAILDSAMGCTLHSILEAGTGYTTLELKVNFLKAITTRIDELHAVGKIIHAGGRTALVEAQLIDKDNTVYAHGVSTCLILKY